MSFAERVSLRCVGLTKRFGSTIAVEELDLAVGQGQVLALLGPSGCGKTTVLRLIAGFEAPDAGTIEIGGRLVAGPGTLLPPDQRRVGMVFQDYALFPHMSVAQNIAYGLRRGRSSSSRRVNEVVSLTGLEGLTERYPHQLSGGEQQRVALARALAPNPEVLLLDEPFSNLDAARRSQVREEVREILQASGTPAIFVTHDQEEALFMGDLVAVQRQGRLEQVDTPERIFHAPRTQFVASFLGRAFFLPVYTKEGALWTEIGPLPGTVAFLPSSNEAKALVRPDDITFEASERGQGRITARTFQGSFYMYEITLASGANVQCLRSHTDRYPVGAQVEVRLDAGHELLCFQNGQAMTR